MTARQGWSHVRWLALAAVVVGATVACTPVEQTRVEPVVPSISSIEAVRTLGQIALPIHPEIVGVSHDSGADERYQLVMRLDAAQREEFLSQFAVGPVPSAIPRSMSVIAGPALDSAPNPLYLQNTVASTDGRYVREIVIDERGPDAVYVHIAVYTT